MTRTGFLSDMVIRLTDMYHSARSGLWQHYKGTMGLNCHKSVTCPDITSDVGKLKSPNEPISRWL